MNREQAIALYQPILQQIAMKMVGSLADAEDIVQDTFLKWLTIGGEKIENTKAYLITAVTNNCINHLNALKKKKDECLHNIHASELIDWYKEKEFFKFDLENEVSAALHVLHKKLEPVEKGIFVLRELFDFDYEELQHIFDKKKDNCRQLFSRAKDKLSQETSKIKNNLSPENGFIESFKKACNIGHPDELIHEVKQEINKKSSGR
ncbi:RNA polymerase ECF-type sigma factor [Fulvivirga imtechensis AK7]|uniref:RNA polymerase ECF-type sigma factor n=1 Tax=Fulvivirga imtechensis AK7 TaxID=1237149 RepID=L8JWV5_9BACT|nr:sigma-70 family RNA polymerase sigma factor [Fulvivirga imtechensis]ELR72114.1 RNA polymerase ECF-type sigma factor [Fulvivirga imtechensis AK7]